ncbi:MAG: RibD family protein, partial [Eubacterium sp.]
GIGTVLADDTALTCRQPGGRNPLRIICDSRLRIPMDSQIVVTAASVPTIIAMVEGPVDKVKALEAAGCEVLPVEKDDTGKVNLKALMAVLGHRGVDSILLEGGAALNASALKAGIVSVIRCYLAPRIFGGKKAPGPVGDLGVTIPDHAIPLELMDVCRIGGDLVIDWRIPCLQAL